MTSIITENERVKKVDDGSLTGKANHLHGAQKPAELQSKILDIVAETGDHIFDSCAGTVSGGRTYLVNGYNSTSCEINPEFFKRGCLAFSDEKIMKTCHERSEEGHLSLGEIHLRGIDESLKKVFAADDAKRDEFFKELYGHNYYCFEDERIKTKSGKKGFAAMFHM